MPGHDNVAEGSAICQLIEQCKYAFLDTGLEVRISVGRKNRNRLLGAQIGAVRVMGQRVIGSLEMAVADRLGLVMTMPSI